MLTFAKSLIILQLYTHIFYGLVLGVVQGISEWLPISSKTQVLVTGTYLLNMPFSEAYTLGLFLEIGTTLAAIIYFRKELWSIIRFIIGKGDAQSKQLFTYVLVTIVITGIIGAPIYIAIDSITGAYNLGIPMLLIGIILIGDALLIWYSKSRHKKLLQRRNFSHMGIKDYVVVGIVQGIAALPGVSRSGITTSSLLLLNVESEEAFRLSFLTGIFATAAAVGLTLLVSHTNVSSAINTIGISGLLVAIVVSLLVSLVLIRFLIKTASHSSIIYLTAALGLLAIFGGAMAWIFNIG